MGVRFNARSGGVGVSFGIGAIIVFGILIFAMCAACFGIGH